MNTIHALKMNEGNFAQGGKKLINININTIIISASTEAWHSIQSIFEVFEFFET